MTIIVILSATMLSIIMLTINTLSVAMLIVIMLTINTLSAALLTVIMLSVVMLNVAAPHNQIVRVHILCFAVCQQQLNPSQIF